MAALEDDPANHRWQEFINVHVDHFEATGSGPGNQVLPRVWSLAEQVG